ncbi:MAG: NACHT domain-containing protein, partial [Pseudonocardiales bacterium]|nr:NACHT domain-containing protein [Pseudonocardiales bacterium]
MAVMSGQQSAASSRGIVAKLAMTLVALAFPALVTVRLWPEVRANPVWSAAVLVIYWLVLAVLRFVGRVGGAVGEKWVPRVADAVDRSVRAVLLGYRSTYLEQLGRSVRDIELLGVATQGEYTLRLQQVYVEVSVLPRALHETSGEPFVGKMGEPAERRTLASFLGGAEPGVFAVIGGPGSGKTTLLRRTALELCQRRFHLQVLPILLYLRDHVDAIVRAADAEPTLPSVAVSVSWMPGKIPADWLKRRLERGRCLVMLDGLDEVTIEDDRHKVVAWVQRQIERYPDNDYVITSRPYGYLTNPLTKANVLQVRRFTGKQISQFIQDWYYAIECRSTSESGDKVRSQSRRKAHDLLSRLRSQPALYDLAANPLLLSMIANVHRYRNALPGSRAALYGEMCDVLLHRRQDAKGLSAGGTGLRGEQKERVVRELALHMMVKKIRDIPAGQAQRALRPALTRVSRDVQPSKFLEETITSGLLVEREAGIYAFAHLTLQEYLAAAEIKERQRTELLTRNVDDPWWRETILLWAAGTDASPAITACLELGSVRALALAFDCADEAREVTPDVRETLDTLEHVLASATNSATTDAAARRRVITAVKVARSLRDVIWLQDDTTAVCANPVARDIYTMFADEEEADGYYRSPDTVADVTASAGEIAVGMRASDAARFIDWVNSLFDDGTAYRLATQNELADNAIGLVTDLSRHSIWAQGDTHPRLYCPNGVPHPYQVTMDHVSRSLTTDRQRTSILLSFTCALARDRDLALALALDLDRALALDLDLDRALDL